MIDASLLQYMKKQISEVPNGYVVRDEIEYAANQIIPLWAFGLMY